MRLPLLTAFVLSSVAACDYAEVESVQRLERDVQSVKTEQRILRNEVDHSLQAQNVLQTSLSAMGSGFNVLTDSVSDQGARVEKLEVQTARVEKDIRNVAKDAATNPPSKKGAEPNHIGMYIGTRFDTQTLDTQSVRMQWCEAAEGERGYLISTGEDPEFGTLNCWRFGDVALFRQETAKGPRVDCMRDVTILEDGSLRALDCDKSSVVYTLRLR